VPKYILQLIYKLRLFKKGHIRLISSLFIGKDKEWYFDNEYNIPLKFFWDNRYKIDEADLDFLDSHLNEPLLDLAFISFNQIYELQSEKLSFVVLIMALESIYNRSGQDPIQHIISRHVSLTLSNSKEEFETLFRKVKDFYNLRSIIVHGSTEKKELIKIENIHDKLEELFDLVRAILKKLIWLYDFEISQPTKNSLFDYLNSKGFTR